MYIYIPSPNCAHVRCKWQEVRSSPEGSELTYTVESEASAHQLAKHSIATLYHLASYHIRVPLQRK